MMTSPCDLPRLTSDAEAEQAQSAASWRVCLLTMGGELFAVDLREVREVFEVDSITPVPGMPPALVGVANIRGVIVPLADLRLSLGAPLSSELRYAIVVRHGSHSVGLLVDDVPEIRTIAPEDILESPGPRVAGGRSFLSGLVRVENRVSGMLEIPTLLASVEEATAKVTIQGSHES